MNITAEQPRIKPTLKQLNKVFKELSDLNRTGPGNVNPFRVIAEKHGDGSASTKALLRGLIKNWKPKHWEMWERAKNYKKDLQN